MAEKNVILKNTAGDTLYPEVAEKNRVITIDANITFISGSNAYYITSGGITMANFDSIYTHITNGGLAYYRVTLTYGNGPKILIPIGIAKDTSSEEGTSKVLVAEKIMDGIWSPTDFMGNDTIYVPTLFTITTTSANNTVNNVLTTKRVATDKISTYQIEDKAITNKLLADYAIKENNIFNRAVTTLKIADKAVKAAKLADGAVTTDKIKDEAVTYTKIADGAVENTHISDKAITLNKLEDTTIHELSDTNLYIDETVEGEIIIRPGKAIFKFFDAEYPKADLSLATYGPSTLYEGACSDSNYSYELYCMAFGDDGIGTCSVNIKNSSVAVYWRGDTDKAVPSNNNMTLTLTDGYLYDIKIKRIRYMKQNGIVSGDRCLGEIKCWKVE